MKVTWSSLLAMLSFLLPILLGCMHVSQLSIQSSNIIQSVCVHVDSTCSIQPITPPSSALQMSHTPQFPQDQQLSDLNSVAHRSHPTNRPSPQNPRSHDPISRSHLLSDFSKLPNVSPSSFQHLAYEHAGPRLLIGTHAGYNRLFFREFVRLECTFVANVLRTCR